MSLNTTEHRQYPIGALSSEETGNILAQPLCVDTISIDGLANDWKAKSQVYKNSSIPNINVVSPHFRPLNVSVAVKQKIDEVIASYRNFIPTDYDLEFVPLNILITPQKSIILERARAFASVATSPLTDDENAEMCLGSPIRMPRIDAKFLGTGLNPQNPNQFLSAYQFESDDQDIRYLNFNPRGTRSALQQVNWSVNGTPHSLNLESIPISVGPGTPLVQVVRVLTGFSIVQGQQVPNYRFVLWNGVHRVFRLAELGNQEVAALVYELSPDDIPNILVETPKPMILSSQRPLLATDLANGTISHTFDWTKANRVIKLQITVNVETTFVT